MIITIILSATAIVAGILAPEGLAVDTRTTTNDTTGPNDLAGAAADACSTAANSNSYCCT